MELQASLEKPTHDHGDPSQPTEVLKQQVALSLKSCFVLIRSPGQLRIESKRLYTVTHKLNMVGKHVFSTGPFAVPHRLSQMVCAGTGGSGRGSSTCQHLLWCLLLTQASSIGWQCPPLRHLYAGEASGADSTALHNLDSHAFFFSFLLELNWARTCPFLCMPPGCQQGWGEGSWFILSLFV